MKKYIAIIGLLSVFLGGTIHGQTFNNNLGGENLNTAAILSAISDLQRDALVARDQISNLLERVRIDYQNIIVSETNIQFTDLNRLIAESRLQVNNILDESFLDIDPFDSEIIENLNREANRYLDQTLSDFENFSGVSFDASSQRQSLNEIISEFTNRISEIQNVIDEADARLLLLDSDGDGLSDFDEIFIYNTDPNNPNTAGGEMTDFEKVMAGLDPTQAEPTSITFQDPRDENLDVKITEILSVTDVMLDESRENLIMKGRALPNSVVTLFVFSTPIVVKVQTDGRGEWTYTFDKELENGEHLVYVATVDNSGRILAQSNPISFVRTAEAAGLGTFGGNQVVGQVEGNFVERNLNLIIIALLLIAIIITISLFGRSPAKR